MRSQPRGPLTESKSEVSPSQAQHFSAANSCCAFSQSQIYSHVKWFSFSDELDKLPSRDIVVDA